MLHSNALNLLLMALSLYSMACVSDAVPDQPGTTTDTSSIESINSVESFRPTRELLLDERSVVELVNPQYLHLSAENELLVLDTSLSAVFRLEVGSKSCALIAEIPGGVYGARAVTKLGDRIIILTDSEYITIQGNVVQTVANDRGYSFLTKGTEPESLLASGHAPDGFLVHVLAEDFSVTKRIIEDNYLENSLGAVKKDVVFHNKIFTEATRAYLYNSLDNSVFVYDFSRDSLNTTSFRFLDSRAEANARALQDSSVSLGITMWWMTRIQDSYVIYTFDKEDKKFVLCDQQGSTLRISTVSGPDRSSVDFATRLNGDLVQIYSTEMTWEPERPGVALREYPFSAFQP